jgi:superfamily I DNA and/or RNA helicase
MEPEALSSFIHLASAATRLIVAGDPEQLGPGRAHCTSEDGEEETLSETLGYHPLYIVKLVRCYLCHPAILHVPNRRFYLARLIPSAPTALVTPPPPHPHPSPSPAATETR